MNTKTTTHVCRFKDTFRFLDQACFNNIFTWRQQQIIALSTPLKPQWGHSNLSTYSLQAWEITSKAINYIIWKLSFNTRKVLAFVACWTGVSKFMQSQPLMTSWCRWKVCTYWCVKQMFAHIDALNKSLHIMMC